MNFLLILAFLIPIMPALPAVSSSKVEGTKRKRNLIPKPLPGSKLPKNRNQARAASKTARVFETVDLLSQQQSDRVNIMQDVTFRPNNQLSNKASVQEPQAVSINATDFTDNIQNFLPLTQTIIDTVFEDRETDDAIQAFMDTLEENQSRPISPDIFEEGQDAYKVDTINFMDEKIALIETKIEIRNKDIEKLKKDINNLSMKLEAAETELKSNENIVNNLNLNLAHFKSFRAGL